MPDTTSSLPSLTHWFNQPLGQAVFAAECEQLATTLSNLFGLHLLQLGCGEQSVWLTKSPIHHRVIVSHDRSSNKTTSVVQSPFDKLPFRNDCIDIVLLPHTLELFKSPDFVLHESWRILSAEGHLIILGFNPWSLFGIKQLFKCGNAVSPWSRKFHSAHKICQALLPLGGEIMTLNYFFFHPPVEKTSLSHKFIWLEFLNQNLFPKTGALYLLAIKKRTMPLTSLPARWQWREVAVDKSLEPSAGRIEHG